MNAPSRTIPCYPQAACSDGGVFCKTPDGALVKPPQTWIWQALRFRAQKEKVATVDGKKPECAAAGWHVSQRRPKRKAMTTPSATADRRAAIGWSEAKLLTSSTACP